MYLFTYSKSLKVALSLRILEMIKIVFSLHACQFHFTNEAGRFNKKPFFYMLQTFHTITKLCLGNIIKHLPFILYGSTHTIHLNKNNAHKGMYLVLQNTHNFFCKRLGNNTQKHTILTKKKSTILSISNSMKLKLKVMFILQNYWRNAQKK